MVEDRPHSRRDALRLIGGAAASLLIPAVVGVRGASAGISWCKADPLVTIGGKRARVYVSSTSPMLKDANGPILVDFYLPFGLTATLDDADNGFGWGYTVRLLPTGWFTATKSRIDLQIRVVAPAYTSLPVTVDFVPADTRYPKVSAGGTTNDWVDLGQVSM